MKCAARLRDARLGVGGTEIPPHGGAVSLGEQAVVFGSEIVVVGGPRLAVELKGIEPTKAS